jgi:uncharacterized protein YecT (DUF1311 family)
MRFRSITVVALAGAPVLSIAGACDNVSANDTLIQCLGAEHSKADAELNRAYAALRGRLDRDSNAVLKAAQVAWLAYRDKDCELRASAATGGQAYQPTYISCQTEKTMRRTQELKEQL